MYLTSRQSRDSSSYHLHFHHSYHADLLEDFCRTPLLPDEIYLPPAYQPVNPEDEDDVVPDQHAAFGINRAIKAGRRGEDAVWRDLGIEALLRRFGGGDKGEGAEGEQAAGASTSGGGVWRFERLLASQSAPGRSGNILRARRAAGTTAGGALRS